MAPITLFPDLHTIPVITPGGSLDIRLDCICAKTGRLLSRITKLPAKDSDRSYRFLPLGGCFKCGYRILLAWVHGCNHAVGAVGTDRAVVIDGFRRVNCDLEHVVLELWTDRVSQTTQRGRVSFLKSQDWNNRWELA